MSGPSYDVAKVGVEGVAASESRTSAAVQREKCRSELSEPQSTPKERVAFLVLWIGYLRLLRALASARLPATCYAAARIQMYLTK